MARAQYRPELRQDLQQPLFQRIARQIARDIQVGVLLPGAALPGSRQLSSALGVHRNTALSALDELTQILRLGLLQGIETLRSWTPTQRDEIDGLAGQIITRKDVRPLRNEGRPVGYLYE